MNGETDTRAAATAPAAPRAPWAYAGTDDTDGVQQVPLTSATSLPAIVVWMTMTTSGFLQQTDLPPGTPGAVDTAMLAQRTGLTKASVESIRNLASQPQNAAAFSAVAHAFRTIGQPTGIDYPPSACPPFTALLSFSPVALAAPVPPAAAEVT